MAKFENELDLVKAKHSVEKYKIQILELFASTPALATLSKTLLDNSNVYCYIFSKSVAFRIGKSSIKSIPGYTAGFKSSFSNKTSKDIFESFSLSTQNSSNNVILIAAYWILMHSSRVRSESDKTEAVESEQVIKTQAALSAIVKEYGSIKLLIGDESYDVDNFNQVMGRPKADMVFTYKNTPVIFVSHKKGSKPGDFQQYGGFANDLDIKNRGDAKIYKDIDIFLAKIEKIMETLGVQKDKQGRYDFNYLKKGSNFACLIDDEQIAYTTMFGKNYKTKKVGLDNCSILIDGDIIFKSTNMGLNVFRLEGSYHTTVNPALLKSKPHFKSDKNDLYSPAMFLMKSESQGLSQGGFANCRAVIWPNNQVIRSYSTKFDAVWAAVNSKNKNLIEKYQKELLK